MQPCTIIVGTLSGTRGSDRGRNEVITYAQKVEGITARPSNNIPWPASVGATPFTAHCCTCYVDTAASGETDERREDTYTSSATFGDRQKHPRETAEDVSMRKGTAVDKAWNTFTSQGRERKVHRCAMRFLRYAPECILCAVPMPGPN